MADDEGLSSKHNSDIAYLLEAALAAHSPALLADAGSRKAQKVLVSPEAVRKRVDGFRERNPELWAHMQLVTEKYVSNYSTYVFRATIWLSELDENPRHRFHRIRKAAIRGIER